MRKSFVTAAAMASCVCAVAVAKPVSELTFDASKGVAGSVTTPMGKVVNYTAYTKLYYVTNVEDSTYQYMNIFVPEGADQSSPIFMPNYVGGYMAAEPRGIDAGDASGRALAEGYVVAIPGARGRNSVVTDGDGNKVYTGRAPKGLLDLKAAVRYLRLFDKEIPGDAEKIITDGTSAGGAMSSLLGATGNNPAYDKYLKAMGAADTRDDIFAAVCFCPIIDLDHADMAYEWLYGCTNNVSRPVTDEQAAVSAELAAQYPAYLASLNLKTADGTPLTADNYLNYVKSFLIQSAQEAKDAGADIPDSLGFSFSNAKSFSAPVNGGESGPGPGGHGGNRPPMGEGMQPPSGDMQPPSGGMPPMGDRQGPPMGRPGDGGPGEGGFTPDILNIMKSMKGEYITDLDMETYLNYVVSTIALKTPPAFDSQGVAGASASGENEEFGDATGSSVNFTDYSLRKATGDASATVDTHIAELVRIMNPMNFITDANSSVAPHWYIRHGARDRDTAFTVPINLATKLQNAGKDVNFKLPWNRPHSGDYALNELFTWLNALVK